MMVKIFRDSILNRFAKHSQVALVMVTFILKAGALILTAQYFGNLLGLFPVRTGQSSFITR